MITDGYFLARSLAAMAIGAYFLGAQDRPHGRLDELTLPEAIGLVAMGVITLSLCATVYEKWQLWPRQIRSQRVPDARMQQIGDAHLKPD